MVRLTGALKLLHFLFSFRGDAQYAIKLGFKAEALDLLHIRKVKILRQGQ